MLRAGIIGAGRITWRYDKGHWDGKRSVTHASCLNRHPDTELVAVFDPIAQSRAAFEMEYAGTGPVACHSDLAAFWAEKLDLVVIASPSHHHVSHILEGFDAQIPYMLIEKPVVLSQADYARVLTAHAQDALQTRTTVNYFRRFLPQTQRLKTYLQTAKHSGSLARVDITYSRGLEINGIHMLDLLGHLFDATACPDLDWSDRIGTQNPSFGVTLQDCPVAVLGIADLDYHGLDIRVTTNEGQMTLTRNGLDLLHAPKVANPDYPGFFQLNPSELQMNPVESHAAMMDGTYLALCDLIGATGLSPLSQSRFAQDLLAKAQDIGA